jgi:2-keto-4-pentenoate hydratase/2-oxohepta-3-ene-1,7-dioic acid hydratase in catechol pathway
VGRNYAEHARELGNPVPREPILFIKPSTALASMDEPIAIPTDRGELHHETEIAVLIGKTVRDSGPIAAMAGIGLALDLTLRDLQTQLKQSGHPWERSKAFNGACPLSRFAPAEQVGNPDQLALSLRVNGDLRQQGSSDQMLFSIVDLIAHMDRWFSLVPGDVVLTGTPPGVSALVPGDRLVAVLDGVLEVETTVVAG